MISMATKLTISFTKLTFENDLALNVPNYAKVIVHAFCCDLLMAIISSRSCLLVVYFDWSGTSPSDATHHHKD